MSTNDKNTLILKINDIASKADEARKVVGQGLADYYILMVEPLREHTERGNYVLVAKTLESLVYTSAYYPLDSEGGMSILKAMEDAAYFAAVMSSEEE